MDAAQGPQWWQPKVGEVKNWDIQLDLARDPSVRPNLLIDVSTPRVMYDLDLWDLVPLDTKLDYGDGDTLPVPHGKLAGTIAQLHARTPPTVVICHVETGVFEMVRPDAVKFPPAAKGATVPGLDAAQYLDTSVAGRAAWAPIMWKRFDLARSIGCDGIEPAHNDVGAYTGTGFTISPEETLSWYAEVAQQGHDRLLSTGMKNGDAVPGLIEMGAAVFDWLMIERCSENGCDVVRPFTDLNKAVLAIDYNISAPDDNGVTHSQDPTTVCPSQVMARIQDGLFKDVALTSLVYTPCEP